MDKKDSTGIMLLINDKLMWINNNSGRDIKISVGRACRQDHECFIKKKKKTWTNQFEKFSSDLRGGSGRETPSREVRANQEHRTKSQQNRKIRGE